MVASTETLEIRPRPTTGMYEIVRTSGGKIHQSMEGLYTSTYDAQKAINFYKANIEQEMQKQDLARQKKEYALQAKLKEEKRLNEQLKKEAAEQAKEEKKPKSGKK